MTWKTTNLAVGLAMSAFFFIMAVGGIKSPIGDMFKGMGGTGSGGRGGSGVFFYGGGK